MKNYVLSLIRRLVVVVTVWFSLESLILLSHQTLSWEMVSTKLPGWILISSIIFFLLSAVDWSDFRDASRRLEVPIRKIIEAKYILNWSDNRAFFNMNFLEDFDREMKEYQSRNADISKPNYK